MNRARSLIRDRRGVSAVEFALLCPVLFGFLIGTAQVGTLYLAKAGLSMAVDEGARAAGVYPRPSDDVIKARMVSKRFGLKSKYLGTPQISTGTDGGAQYVQIRLSYTVPLDFVFYSVKPVTLTKTRRVYIYS
ncbi:MAG TPA: TadE/TadG family type IV pilus assembly protein [Allosphingosinicella sp.]|jgi:Flp pilus assembly pilin Flp